MLVKLWKARRLLASLVRRTYQIRYRQSFVGFWWAILPSLGMLAVGFLVFDKVAGVETGKEGYALLTMAALVPWTLFVNSLTSGVSSVSSNGQMVSRLPFARGVLPLSSMGSALIGTAISSLIFLIIAVWSGQGLPATALWFPVLLVVELVFISGLLFLGSALDVFARDIRLAVPLAAQLWLLITPVMYTLDSVKSADLRDFYLLNPMTGVVEASRSLLVYGRLPEASLVIPSAVAAIVIFATGCWYFGATENRFADVI